MFNGLGAGNIGDEAMFLAFADRYHLPPGTTIEVYDHSAPIVKTLPEQFQYVDWRDDARNNQSARDSCAVLLVGNTPVMSDWGLDYPLRALAKRLLYCHSRGIPVHAVGVGVDYLREKAARRIFRDAFLPVATWTVRSSNCRAALLGLDVPSERITLGADLAWLFSPSSADKQWAEDFWKSLGVDLSRPLLGVNVVNERWAKNKEVKNSLAKALDCIIAETGLQVAFLCNETREGKYFDASAAKKVVSMMRRDAVFVPNHYITPSQMIALLSFCSITLSQRYHFTLFSILADTVPISFARGQKMASLLEELGDRPVGTMETCNSYDIEREIRHALANIPDIRNRQQSASSKLKERAAHDFSFLHAMPCNSAPTQRLANVSEIKSARFIDFMDMLNSRAKAWGLRKHTNWSKVWEYPWLWFNGLNSQNWPRLRVLDLGSELGPMPWFLGSLGATVTLVERDPQWLSKWKRLAKKTGMKIDWCIVGDDLLPFPEQSFNVVTSFSVIEHQRDKRLALQEVARVLKPGGTFAVSFDICEPDMGMTFPEWNGAALTMKEFEELLWENPAFDNGGKRPDWNIGDCQEFIRWHRKSAPHHNYVVGAAVIRRRIEEFVT